MEIPAVVNKAKVYDNEDTNQIIGISGEITLPTLEGKTVEVSGTGILGDIEAVIVGMFGSTNMEIPFVSLTKDAYKMMKTNKPTGMTIRTAIQGFNTENSQATFTPMKIVVKGMVKSINPGKVKAGEQMDASLTLEVTYIKIEYDGITSLELDKLNEVFVVDGEDMLADVRAFV